MSNLSNLHISGSYKGLINLADSTQPLISQSGDVNLQDGMGNNVGVKINATSNDVTIDNKLLVQKDLTVNGNTDLNGNLDVSGSFVHSGSIDIKGNVVIDGNINAEIATFDTVNTRLLHVTEESASVIFSSGSNVIGDDITDVQTIVGQTTISGSLGITGNQTNTGNLDVSGEISSSTVNGIGNVTTYSASVDSRLDQLEGPFSTSVDSRLDSLETFETSQQARNSVLGTYTSSVDSSLASINSFTSSTDSSLNAINSFTSSTDSSLTSINAFTQSADSKFTTIGSVTSSLNAFTSSQLTINSGYNSFTQSADTRITALENFSSSLEQSFVDTGSFNSYTQSTDNRLNQIEIKTGSLQNEVNSLIASTGSYARTDTNNTFSGSVNGEVITLTITSQTASMDLSQGNFFVLNAVNSSNTHIVGSNIQAGQTISLKVKQPGVGSGTVSFNSEFKFPLASPYTASLGSNLTDVISMVTYDTTNIFAVSVNNLV